MKGVLSLSGRASTRDTINTREVFSTSTHKLVETVARVRGDEQKTSLLVTH